MVFIHLLRREMKEELKYMKRQDQKIREKKHMKTIIKQIGLKKMPLASKHGD